MGIGALKLSIFATFIALMGWKAVQGLVATESAVRKRAYGGVATKPAQAGVVAVVTAAVGFGGYWFAEYSYIWLVFAVVNLFAAILVYGQSRVHDRAMAMDAELALAIDQADMTKKVRTRRLESFGQIAIILVWIYAWRNVLAIT